MQLALNKNELQHEKKNELCHGVRYWSVSDKCAAYSTCISQLVEREAIDLQVPLETLLVHPWRQAAVFVLWNTQMEFLLPGGGTPKQWVTVHVVDSTE